MRKFRLFSFCLIGFCSFWLSCDITAEEPVNSTTTEQLIINEWQFVFLLINRDTITNVDMDLEPIRDIYVPFFWFEYNKDKTYEFRADFRTATLGIEENYQPNYGYWEIDEGLNLLIHNRGMQYETSYNIIELSDTLFIREYERIIYRSYDTVAWPIGQIAIYREVLEKRKGPCCD